MHVKLLDAISSHTAKGIPTSPRTLMASQVSEPDPEGPPQGGLRTTPWHNRLRATVLACCQLAPWRIASGAESWHSRTGFRCVDARGRLLWRLYLIIRLSLGSCQGITVKHLSPEQRFLTGSTCHESGEMLEWSPGSLELPVRCCSQHGLCASGGSRL